MQDWVAGFDAFFLGGDKGCVIWSPPSPALPRSHAPDGTQDGGWKIDFHCQTA